MSFDKKLGLLVTEDEVSQTIPKSWIGDIDRDTAFEIAYKIREYIERRSLKGRGLGKTPFNPNVYSEAYQKSDEFKAYGKTPKPVNMRLTGDMLRSIEIAVTKDGRPYLGITDENAPKAHGHQTGQYGEGPLPKREFFGVTKDEFESIVKPFKKRIEADLKSKKPSYSESVDSLRPVTEAIDTLKELQSLKKLIKLIK